MSMSTQEKTGTLDYANVSDPAQSEIQIPHGGTVKPHGEAHEEGLHLPAPTPWPIVTALGFTLLVAGILTHYAISIFGFLMLTYGCVKWFQDVLPHEAHEPVDVRVQEIAVASSRKTVARIGTNSLTASPKDDKHRAHLPLEGFSVLTGLKGGIAGGIAMIVPALAYGLIFQHSVWYPINLLGGAGISSTSGVQDMSMESLRAFHAQTLGIAIIIHAVSCTLIGLLYGSVLPVLPKHPVILGGIIAPLAWSGLLFATLPTINPVMSSHINWPDFLVSQFTFGLVAGLVVSRSDYVRTAQSLPFALRLGLEAPGLMHQDADKKDHVSEDRS